MIKETDGGSEELYYFHKDHLGSTTLLTNQDGNVINKPEPTDYLPFGLERSDKTKTQDVTARKFTDQEFDVETGLYNYNARLYDPALRMFISPDSIYPDLYDPQSLNRYTYCKNNPLKYTDPSGHYWDYDDDKNEYEQLDGPPENYAHDQYLDEKLLNGADWNDDGRLHLFEVIFGGVQNERFTNYILQFGGVSSGVYSPKSTLGVWQSLFGGASKSAIRKGTPRYSQLMNKLNRFKNVKGDKTVTGKISHAESDFLGKRWVGENHKVVTTKKGDMIYISKDGLRQYRSPTSKSSSYTQTGVQANFQGRDFPIGDWINNAHIDVH